MSTLVKFAGSQDPMVLEEAARLHKRIVDLEGVLEIYAQEENWGSHDGYLWLMVMGAPWSYAAAALRQDATREAE